MIDSLYLLTARRESLRKAINNSELKLSNIWDDLFHCKENASKTYSPTQKVLNFISSSSVVIDGLLLGWKLYSRFGRHYRKR